MVIPWPRAVGWPPVSVLDANVTPMLPLFRAAAWKWSPLLLEKVQPVTDTCITDDSPDSIRMPSSLLLSVDPVTEQPAPPMVRFSWSNGAAVSLLRTRMPLW